MADITVAASEKGVVESTTIISPSNSDTDIEKGHPLHHHDSALETPLPIPIPSTLRRINGKIESLAGLEARGITRVEPDERHESSITKYVQMSLLWFSANLTANNLAVGFLGPLLFQLGFTDAALMGVWGAFVGSLITAYMSTWGAASGNRTLVCNPFQCREFILENQLWLCRIACREVG